MWCLLDHGGKLFTVTPAVNQTPALIVLDGFEPPSLIQTRPLFKPRPLFSNIRQALYTFFSKGNVPVMREAISFYLFVLSPATPKARDGRYCNTVHPLSFHVNWDSRVILSNVQTDSQLDLILILVTFLWNGANNDQNMTSLRLVEWIFLTNLQRPLGIYI